MSAYSADVPRRAPRPGEPRRRRRRARPDAREGACDHMGLCRFHAERAASFSVSEAKQFYYCFGCQASGNALTFLVEHQRGTFPETVETLAVRLRLEPREAESGTAANPTPENSSRSGTLDAGEGSRVRSRDEDDTDRAAGTCRSGRHGAGVQPCKPASDRTQRLQTPFLTDLGCRPSEERCRCCPTTDSVGFSSAHVSSAPSSFRRSVATGSRHAGPKCRSSSFRRASRAAGRREALSCRPDSGFPDARTCSTGSRAEPGFAGCTPRRIGSAHSGTLGGHLALGRTDRSITASPVDERESPSDRSPPHPESPSGSLSRTWPVSSAGGSPRVRSARSALVGLAHVL